ncbi:MAG: site-2 protease family protein [Clostridia bacterium]|nr:site-2 protease family protein [Clostridia bacterium]
MLFNFSLTGFLVIIPVVLISLTIHELAHGLVADKFGDPTPRVTGRLTLNPIKHLDPMGAILLAIVGFGWAKPVMVNPYNFKKRSNLRKQMMYVALAGPISNILLAIITGILYVQLTSILGGFGQLATTFFTYLIMINVFLAAFNLLPIPPLDGSKILGAFLSENAYQKYMLIEDKGFLILMILVITNATQYIVRPIANIILDFVYFVASIGL